MMTIDTLGQVEALLDKQHIRYWIFGGWGLDGVRGRISREHHDIDVYVFSDDIKKLGAALKSTMNVELARREQMYFVVSEQLELGVVPITDDGSFLIAHGNKTTVYFPQQLFGDKMTAEIGSLRFSRAPDEALALDAQFSKYEADRELGRQLPRNEELFKGIRIERIRD
jgi:hypothetical protein